MHSSLLLILVLSPFLKVKALTFDPEVGVYRDLLVAIAPDALPTSATQEERETLVENCKTLVQSLSAGLLDAVNTEIANAHILVPREWNFTSIPDIQLRFAAADVRVDAASELHGDLPYTHQPHPCSVQGRYIHVTPNFVSSKQEVIDRTGPPERVLVHEWAQFRWGVREEYGYPGDLQYPYFHMDPNGNWVPTGSNTTAIVGNLHTTSNEACSFGANGVPSLDCRFFPDVTSSASIMHFHHLQSAVIFSTKDDFNRLSPNKQSNICALQSAWEVISAHDDMQLRKRNTKKNKRLSSRLQPEISVAQSDLTSTIAMYIVIDLTENVDPTLTDSILSTYHTELTDFFMRSSDNLLISLQTYQAEENITELVPLGKVGTNKDALISAVATLEMVPGARDTQTPLLQIAEQAQREQNGTKSTLFFTQNGRGTKLETEAIPALQEANMGVIGVTFIESSNGPHLFTISSSTGGRSYILQEPLGPSFQEAIDFAALGDDPSTRNYQVKNEWLTLMPNENYETSVYIEEALGHNARFAMTYIDSMVEPTLMDPTGTQINMVDECENLLTSKLYLCSFENALSGIWHVSFTCRETCSSSGILIQLSVTSYLRPTADPAWPTMETWTSGKEGVVDFEQDELYIYTELRQKYQPLVNASITATLEDTRVLTRVKYILKDDGREPDTTAGDGVYTAKMQPISSNPMSVSVHVSSDISSIRTMSEKHPGWGILPIDQDSYCCGLQSDPSVVADPYKMERTLNLSVIIRAVNIDNEYRMAPQVIEDLLITHIKLVDDQVFITLSWTSPEARDGTSNDTVSAYHLYYSMESDKILDNITQATLVTTNIVSDPSDLEPLSPGLMQSVDININFTELYAGPIFFRIRSNNSYNELSPLSRVTYTFVNVSEIPNETTTQASTTIEDSSPSSIGTTPGDNGDDGDDTGTLQIWFLILMGVAALGLVGVVFASVYLIVQKIKARRSNSQENLNSSHLSPSVSYIEESSKL